MSLCRVNNVLKANEVTLVDCYECVAVSEKSYPSRRDAKETDQQEKTAEGKCCSSPEELKIAEDKAYERGFMDGIEKGRKEENADLRYSLEAAEKLAVELRECRKGLLRDSEKDLVAIAYAIAEKIIHREVEIKPDIVVNVLDKFWDSLCESETISIRCNPGDCDYIKEVKPDLFQRGTGKNTEVTPDAGIERGGVIIETSTWGIDARIDEQLKRMRETLALS